jgi:hypothetical protein
VDGGNIIEPGGAKMEPDRYWLLLLVGAATLLAIIMLDRAL